MTAPISAFILNLWIKVHPGPSCIKKIAHVDLAASQHLSLASTGHLPPSMTKAKHLVFPEIHTFQSLLLSYQLLRSGQNHATVPDSSLTPISRHQEIQPTLPLKHQTQNRSSLPSCAVTPGPAPYSTLQEAVATKDPVSPGVGSHLSSAQNTEPHGSHSTQRAQDFNVAPGAPPAPFPSLPGRHRPPFSGHTASPLLLQRNSCTATSASFSSPPLSLQCLLPGDVFF